MAEALARAGADIIGVSAQPRGDGERGAARASRPRGARSPALPRRPRATATRSPASRHARRDRHPIDILVNNAGHDRARARRRAHRRDVGRGARRSNLTAPFVLTRELGAAMVERGRGQDHLHRVAAELPGRHQRGRATPPPSPGSPGSCARSPTSGRRTASTSTRSRPATSRPTTPRRCATTPTAHRAILERIPAGRWGEPSDLAGATVFLASQRRTTSTASCSPVDGGWLGR